MTGPDGRTTAIGIDRIGMGLYLATPPDGQAGTESGSSLPRTDRKALIKNALSGRATTTGSITRRAGSSDFP